MKIGIDISQVIYKTGVSDYTKDLVNALISQDSDNNYILFGSSFRRRQELLSQFPNATTFSIPPMALHLLWNKLHIMNVENLIGSVDVFHSSDWTQPPSSSAKVTTVHDLSPFIYPEAMSSGFFRNITAVHSARMKWVVRECQKIICVSNHTASVLQSLFKIPSSRIEVIPEALPTRFQTSVSSSQKQTVKKKYKIGSEYLLAVGTPQPRKNISRLVRAYLQYKSALRLPDQLVIVGGHGWGLTDIPSDPSVIFTGYVPDADLSALYAAAQCLVFPSLDEGFGLPILIAFHHHLPVVTSNLSSLPEIAGSAAVLVDPNSEESIADGVAQAIKSRSKLIKSGDAQLRKFTWENTAKQTLMVYSSVC